MEPEPSATDTAQEELNRLYAEKGRFYARYFAGRPDRLNNQLPDSDQLLDEVMNELQVQQQRADALDRERVALKEQVAQQAAVLSTAGVQLALGLARHPLFRVPWLRRMGEFLVRSSRARMQRKANPRGGA
jgi:hypothetical protein